MPPANMDLYYSTIGFARHPAFNRIREALIDKMGFQLRQIARYDYFTKKVIPDRIQQGEIPLSLEERGRSFAMMYMLPVAIALKLSDGNKYQDFIDGKAPEELSFLESDINGNYGLKDWLVSDKTNDNDMIQYEIRDGIQKAYDFLFAHENLDSNVSLRIGSMIIDYTARQAFYKKMSDLKSFLG